MISNKAVLNIIIRVVLIVVTAIVFAFYCLNSSYLIIIINLLILIAIQTYLLIRVLLKSFKQLEQYVDNLEFNDQVYLTNYDDRHFNTIGEKFNYLSERISDSISEFKVRATFLESMLNHIDIAIVCIDKDDKFEIVNNEAKKLFNRISPGMNERYFKKNVFFDELKKINVSEKVIYSFGPQYENKRLLINAYGFKSPNSEKRIITLQDIKDQLDTTENDSWQKLSYYLSHEIMNSVTPIISTVKGISKIYLSNNLNRTEHNKEEIELVQEIMEGVDIIQERSEGLKKFISDYRNLFEIEKVSKEAINLRSFFSDLLQSQINLFKEKNIELAYDAVPVSLVIEADKVLLEQVILNLLKNSIQAVEEVDKAKVQIKAFVNFQENIQIDIEDNGVGIPEEINDKIFIPFFSTKKDGSGIGLSLSRYIMQLHKGQINLASGKGKTIFSLLFT